MMKPQPEPVAEMLKTLQVDKTLTPADLLRCQAEVLGGSFMTLGPRPWVRCTAKPAWIATENYPGPDGKVGSMSLCEACYRESVKALEPGRVRYVRL